MVTRSRDQRDGGKRLNSTGWVKGAFALTSPSDFVGDIVCIDDCEECPLFSRGCAGKCTRWDDLVCSGCPCLGSKYNGRAEVTTVDPDTLEPEAPDPRLAVIRRIRESLRDGQRVDQNAVEYMEEH
jgi:hypothetical protein